MNKKYQTDLRERLEDDRAQRDVQWYRSMEVLHMVCDVLDPPVLVRDRRLAMDIP